MHNPDAPNSPTYVSVYYRPQSRHCQYTQLALDHFSLKGNQAQEQPRLSRSQFPEALGGRDGAFIRIEASRRLHILDIRAAYEDVQRAGLGPQDVFQCRYHDWPVGWMACRDQRFVTLCPDLASLVRLEASSCSYPGAPNSRKQVLFTSFRPRSRYNMCVYTHLYIYIYMSTCICPKSPRVTVRIWSCFSLPDRCRKFHGHFSKCKPRDEQPGCGYRGITCCDAFWGWGEKLESQGCCGTQFVV